MRRYHAELVALILAHASSEGVQLLSAKLCAAALRYVRSASSFGSFSASAAARSSAAIGSICALYATENGTGSSVPLFSRTTTKGSRSAFAFGAFSSLSQNAGSFWSAAGYASQIGFGAPGIAEHAGFFSV